MKTDFEVTDNRTLKLKGWEKLHCSWCAPNKGCNQRFKRKKRGTKTPKYKCNNHNKE